MRLEAQKSGQVFSALQSINSASDLSFETIMTAKLKETADAVIYGLYIDKLNIAIQCHLPLKLCTILMDLRDNLISAVSFVNIAGNVTKLRSDGTDHYNDRKDLLLSLSRKFIGLSMMISEKEFLMGRRQQRCDQGSKMGDLLQNASYFILQSLMTTMEEDWDRLELLVAEFSDDNVLSPALRAENSNDVDSSKDSDFEQFKNVLNISIKVYICICITCDSTLDKYACFSTVIF